MTEHPVLSVPLQPGRILIVDDSVSSRILLRDILEEQGHEVLEAGDGLAGWEACRREQPDAVLLDVMMPGQNGYQVCHRIKSDASTAAISVLLVTSLTEGDARLRGIEVGADDFLPKPVDHDTLILRVRNAVRQRQLLRAAARRASPPEREEGFIDIVPHDSTTALSLLATSMAMLQRVGPQHFLRGPGHALLVRVQRQIAQWLGDEATGPGRDAQRSAGGKGGMHHGRH